MRYILALTLVLVAVPALACSHTGLAALPCAACAGVSTVTTTYAQPVALPTIVSQPVVQQSYVQQSVVAAPPVVYQAPPVVALPTYTPSVVAVNRFAVVNPYPTVGLGVGVGYSSFGVGRFGAPIGGYGGFGVGFGVGFGGIHHGFGGGFHAGFGGHHR